MRHARYMQQRSAADAQRCARKRFILPVYPATIPMLRRCAKDYATRAYARNKITGKVSSEEADLAEERRDAQQRADADEARPACRQQDSSDAAFDNAADVFQERWLSLPYFIRLLRRSAYGKQPRCTSL